jgi:hypothetical protein
MGRIRHVVASGAVLALSLLAAVTAADLPGAAPAPLRGGASNPPPRSNATSVADAKRAFTQGADVFKKPSAQRPANANLAPRVPVGALIDTITLSAVQPVVAGRARLALMAAEATSSAPLTMHAVTWDTEANLIGLFIHANGQTNYAENGGGVQTDENELAIHVNRDVGRVYILSCTMTAPNGECYALTTAEGWSKNYTVPHDAQGMVFWVLPVRQREAAPAWTKASLVSGGVGANLLISKCELATYAAPPQ